METLRKNQKEMLEIKTTLTKMSFEGLIIRLDMAEERIDEPEAESIETS